MSPPDTLAAFLADMPVSSRAAIWAANAHSGQKRAADGAPFVLHPYEVALMLHGGGYADETIAAGLLHDVVEKAGVPVEDVHAAFGPRIATMVATLSEDLRIPGDEGRRQALRDAVEAADDDTLAVFAADKVVKARELAMAATAGRMPAAEVAVKRAHHVASLGVLERRLPAHPFTDQLRFELEAHLVIPALAWLAGASVPVAP